ncbi:p115 like vesicle tethering protein [Immersiella caudata]|uniref:P115 like vesicle tethering protein n=1 Tax=Immersiella caudata TaxID=314043 RepID=A0AA39X2K8_9PEZI|nr:p115 like vesicle tethering protein [Immersiella caudata]
MFSTITTAPAKQSVSETIAVYSGRLSTSTLLEDRRSAILGLRSFAKQFPASVASGALRGLIGSLSKDGEDVDTVKIVLETLLMLFSPNQDSPEASEEIALWLADEFTQRQENITLLLDFLDTTDFYSRLYSLQLLAAILSARTERTEECILVAPMGIPRLVAVLDDRREAIRNEAISLLTDLTPASIDIQKLVAFEKGFERVFGIINEEGGLVDGARVVEDCLILLANLLRLNASNQSMFREMGFIAQLGRLLRAAYKGDESGQEIAQWAEAQRNRNIYALLAVLRLFLVAGAVGTSQNQVAFLGGVLENTLQLAFTRTVELPIRTEALVACADMIKGNRGMQESFAGLQVPSPLAEMANGQGPQSNGVSKVFVIDGLLDITLALSSLQAFDLRMAACQCLKAYFYQHKEIREHFLTRAIHGHKIKADELTNVLTTLLQPLPEAVAADPYRYWFAAVLMLHLIHDSPETKALAMAVTEGDEASGEEVVTSIQTLAAHLISTVAKAEDPRVIIGYLMVLLCWLFEDPDGVNDFLDEFTNLQGIIQAAIENPNGDVIVQGLSAMLAAVVYEFSTKDSPLPRATVQSMILKRMGRDRYVDKLAKLRSHPFMRDFEVLPQKLLDPSGGLPDVYLDDTFVEFFKDNYSRILRAIDRQPDLEISVVTNGVEKGVSRELVDALRAQINEKDEALKAMDAEKSSLSSKLGQAQADERRAKDEAAASVARANAAAESLRSQLTAKERLLQTASDTTNTLRTQLSQEQEAHHKAKTEMSRLKNVNDGLQRYHEEEMKMMKAKLRAREEELNAKLRAKEEELTKKLQAQEQEFTKKLAAKEDEHQRALDIQRKTSELESERVKRRIEAEMADLKATKSRIEVDLMKANKAKATAEAKVIELEGKVKGVVAELEGVKEKMETLEGGLRKEVDGKEEERRAVQGELDDLLIVFSDLEEKAEKYKVCFPGSESGWGLKGVVMVANVGNRNVLRHLGRVCRMERMKMRKERTMMMSRWDRQNGLNFNKQIKRGSSLRAAPEVGRWVLLGCPGSIWCLRCLYPKSTSQAVSLWVTLSKTWTTSAMHCSNPKGRKSKAHPVRVVAIPAFAIGQIFFSFGRQPALHTNFLIRGATTNIYICQPHSLTFGDSHSHLPDTCENKKSKQNVRILPSLQLRHHLVRRRKRMARCQPGRRAGGAACYHLAGGRQGF